jgi:molecular chaperone GrpE
LEDRLRRVFADLDNERKRSASEMERTRVAERSTVASGLLPMLDDLDRALRHTDDAESLAAGVRTVRDQAVALLSTLGYPRDEETGLLFDPFRHEAVELSAGSDSPPGTVLEVVRPGYGRTDNQLRPASVVVVATPNEVGDGG